MVKYVGFSRVRIRVIVRIRIRVRFGFSDRVGVALPGVV